MTYARMLDQAVGEQQRWPRRGDVVAVIVATLVAARLVYHASYIREVPFALVTVSDGRLYEQAAFDILNHPPLGSEPFYLQGAYAYFMAAVMSLRPWPSLVVLLQLAVGALALWGFWRTAVHTLGPRAGALAGMILLAYPMLAFYENKFLTAALTVAAEIAMLAAFANVDRARTRGGHRVALGLLGLATAAAILLRPNFVLVVPFVALALATGARRRGGARLVPVAGFVGAVAFGLAPMAWRNVAVTGALTVFPVHGGGTSFYIGNNLHARGTWNRAGGLLSGDVGREQVELANVLGIAESDPSERAAAIGQVLYRRAWTEIRERPMRWVELELRKAWLLVGNDELSQDFDLAGERELTGFDPRWGLPFGGIVILAVIGAVRWRRRFGSDAVCDSAPPPGLGWLLAGLVFATAVANLGFFVSAQHRLPLVVPLAWLAGLGLDGVGRAVQHAWRRRTLRPVLGPTAVVVGLTVVVAWPRARGREQPAPEHYYNLGLAFLASGSPERALTALERARALAPEDPTVRREHERLVRRLERRS